MSKSKRGDSKNVESGISHKSSTASGFSDDEIRSAFIAKVYAIMACMMALTVVICCAFMYFDVLGDFLRNAPYSWPALAALACFLVLSTMLICSEFLRRTVPINYIFLFLLAGLQSIIVSNIVVKTELEAVLIAVVVTLVVCLLVSGFACCTTFDFTLLWPWLMVGSVVLIIMMVVMLIIQNKILSLVIATFGVLLAVVYLAFDTQLIVGGRRYQLSAEEYAHGALILYIDIINIFMFLMQILRAIRA